VSIDLGGTVDVKFGDHGRCTSLTAASASTSVISGYGWQGSAMAPTILVEAPVS